MVDPPVSNQTPTHASRPPCPLPPPRPRPTSTRLGKPAPLLPGTSRKGGPARSGGPPFLESPGGKRKTGRGRGGGLLRSWEKPIERNRWRETHGGKQRRRPCWNDPGWRGRSGCPASRTEPATDLPQGDASPKVRGPCPPPSQSAPRGGK